MPIINCYVDDDTMAVLKRISAESGRPIDELAESAIAETALRAKIDFDQRSSQSTKREAGHD